MSEKKQVATLDDVLAELQGIRYLLALLVRQKGFTAQAALYLEKGKR